MSRRAAAASRCGRSLYCGSYLGIGVAKYTTVRQFVRGYTLACNTLQRWIHIVRTRTLLWRSEIISRNSRGAAIVHARASLGLIEGVGGAMCVLLDARARYVPIDSQERRASAGWRILTCRCGGEARIWINWNFRFWRGKCFGNFVELAVWVGFDALLQRLSAAAGKALRNAVAINLVS